MIMRRLFDNRLSEREWVVGPTWNKSPQIDHNQKRTITTLAVMRRCGMRPWVRHQDDEKKPACADIHVASPVWRRSSAFAL
jgi:hypothetical protein